MAFQAAIASSVNHTVRLPRWRSASLYAAQFVTRRFGRGIWWRRSALYLCGMKARSGASKQATPYAIPHIRATRCRRRPTGDGDKVQVMGWRGTAWAAPGDFGPVIMPINQALEFIATESFFWINA